MLDFMEGWYQHRHVPADFMLARYESMRANPAEELGRILSFLGLGLCDDHIQRAVEYASFSNMRRMSMNELQHVKRFAPTDPGNPDSFKVRRGKVRGYLDYLTAADLTYVEERMAERLSPALGYARHE
jgi:hypothetical protein